MLIARRKHVLHIIMLVTPFVGPTEIIRHILCNPEEVLVELHCEYNSIQEDIKHLLNNAPQSIDVVLDFKACRERQESIIAQVEQLFAN